MIDYKRSEISRPDGPRDVEVVTDDSNAEMAGLHEMIAVCAFDIKLPDNREPDGNFRFTIPGAAVGEFADCVEEIDGGKLSDLTEKWNEEALSALDAMDE